MLGIWAQLRGHLCFSVSDKLLSTCWPGLWSHLSAPPGKDLLPSSWGCWQNSIPCGLLDWGSGFPWVVGWNCPQLLATRASPVWKFASLMEPNKSVEKVCQKQRELRVFFFKLISFKMLAVLGLHLSAPTLLWGMWAPLLMEHGL